MGSQCYLPPGRDDSPNFTLAFISTNFTVPRKVEGWVNLGTAVRVHNPCPRLYIAVVVVINTRPQCASILGPNTPQLSLLPLDHCDLGLWSSKGKGQFWGKFGASHCNQWGLCCIVVWKCMQRSSCHWRGVSGVSHGIGVVDGVNEWVNEYANLCSAT